MHGWLNAHVEHEAACGQLHERWPGAPDAPGPACDWKVEPEPHPAVGAVSGGRDEPLGG